jgi:uncharacterized protein (TIGR00255 family)
VARYLSAYREAAAEFGITGEADLNAALRMPGVFERTQDKPPEEREVIRAFTECIAQLNHHREREGAALIGEFLREADAIEHQAEEIKRIRATATPQFQQRLRDRLAELLSQANVAESRLAEEAAILTDRSDVQEELARLTIHVGELRRMLDEGGEIGKRLDFLLQEMNRETNTILSKTSGIGDTGLAITNLGLAIKANIEKIREQALNIE